MEPTIDSARSSIKNGGMLIPNRQPSIDHKNGALSSDRRRKSNAEEGFITSMRQLNK